MKNYSNEEIQVIKSNIKSNIKVLTDAVVWPPRHN